MREADDREPWTLLWAKRETNQFTFVSRIWGHTSNSCIKLDILLPAVVTDHCGKPSQDLLTCASSTWVNQCVCVCVCERKHFRHHQCQQSVSWDLTEHGLTEMSCKYTHTHPNTNCCIWQTLHWLHTLLEALTKTTTCFISSLTFKHIFPIKLNHLSHSN